MKNVKVLLLVVVATVVMVGGLLVGQYAISGYMEDGCRAHGAARDLGSFEGYQPPSHGRTSGSGAQCTYQSREAGTQRVAVSSFDGRRDLVAELVSSWPFVAGAAVLVPLFVVARIRRYRRHQRRWPEHG